MKLTIWLCHLIQKLGSPKNIGQKEHEDKFIQMLNDLNQWANDLDLNDWKRSSINGSIEATLKKTYKNCGVDDVISSYVTMSQKTIMKM